MLQKKTRKEGDQEDSSVLAGGCPNKSKQKVDEKQKFNQTNNDNDNILQEKRRLGAISNK